MTKIEVRKRHRFINLLASSFRLVLVFSTSNPIECKPSQDRFLKVTQQQ